MSTIVFDRSLVEGWRVRERGRVKGREGLYVHPSSKVDCEESCIGFSRRGSCRRATRLRVLSLESRSWCRSTFLRFRRKSHPFLLSRLQPQMRKVKIPKEIILTMSTCDISFFFHGSRSNVFQDIPRLGNVDLAHGL